MSVGAGQVRPSKRRKVEDGLRGMRTYANAEQLSRLLHQSPNTPAEEINEAITQFRDFLATAASVGEPARSQQLKILKQYCEDQSSSSHDQVDLPDLISAWSNANQANTESILSNVPATLVQFFRTIDDKLDFREFGLSLCHSLLKRDQLRIFDRCLSSPRTKEHLITPCLQLLTEIASFDAGALANNVFSRRDFLYRRLESIVGQNSSGPPVPQEGAREAALLFILSNLKYLDAASKSELITHGRLTWSAIRSLPNASEEVVVSFLEGLGSYIVEDNTLSKQLKIRCFNSGVLTVLGKLYDYQVDGVPSPVVLDALQKLLIQICASPKGVLMSQTGWYPNGTNPDVLDHNDNMIDLGLDSPFHSDDYSDKVPVRNGMMSAFLQSLKPENGISQIQLMVQTFEAAPELVADYFTKKRRFSVGPDDSSDPRWLAQVALIYNTICLPVPKYFGWHEKLPMSPPPVSIVIESILPRSFDRTTIGKCLRSPDEDMVLSATRILTVALQKLSATLKVIQTTPSQTSTWSQASDKILNMFSERIPTLHDIITAFQKLSGKDQRPVTAALECIAMYLEVLPASASTSKFDFGSVLCEGLQLLNAKDKSNAVRERLAEQTKYLVKIVDLSPMTKWYQKPSSEDLSVVMQLLQSCVSQSGSLERQAALTVIERALHDKGVITNNKPSSAALVSSLTGTEKWQPGTVTYQFLDNCISRTVQRPVKYLDQLEQEQQLLSDATPLSLLVCCIAEQWQFVVKNEDKAAIKNAAEWIARYFSAADTAGENYRVIISFKESMLKDCGTNDKARSALEKAFEKQRKKPLTLPESQSDKVEEEVLLNDSGAESPQQEPRVDLSTVYSSAPAIPASLSGLDRWTKPDFESEIQSSRLANLIRCLISPEAEVRLQAFYTLQNIIHEVDQSSYEEKSQLYLMLGELSETVKAHTLSNPITSPPSIVAELAIHFLPIIAEPSSPFYRKTNNFLLRAPSWSIQHIIPHWITETFLAEPEVDDADMPFHLPQGTSSGSNNAQALEVEHFLDLLLNSLRTEDDMNLLRRSHIFTRLFSYYLAPITPKHIRKKILRLVFAATNIKGGSDTLITRTGVREWLKIAKTMRGHSGHGPLLGRADEETNGIIAALEKEVEKTCDKAYIGRWQTERKVLHERTRNKPEKPAQQKTKAKKLQVNGTGNGPQEDHDDTSSSGSSSDSDSESDSSSSASSTTEESIDTESDSEDSASEDEDVDMKDN